MLLNEKVGIESGTFDKVEGFQVLENKNIENVTERTNEHFQGKKKARLGFRE